jgi:phosphoribosylformylglycinamidine (FGAM) synthase-like enzyme
MRIKGTGAPGHERGLAMALDGNGRWCYLDPKLGAMHAVAEAARKVACTGATPVAATNCLNFGNPEKPEIMAQLSAAIDGIAEACTALSHADYRRQRFSLQRDQAAKASIPRRFWELSAFWTT